MSQQNRDCRNRNIIIVPDRQRLDVIGDRPDMPVGTTRRHDHGIREGGLSRQVDDDRFLGFRIVQDAENERE